MGLAKYAEDNMEIYIERMDAIRYKQYCRIEVSSTMPIKFECQTDNSFVNNILTNIAYQNTYQDRYLVCKECSGIFVWTAGEQAYFKKRNLHRPRRCKICREFKKKMCS